MNAIEAAKVADEASKNRTELNKIELKQLVEDVVKQCMFSVHNAAVEGRYSTRMKVRTLPRVVHRRVKEVLNGMGYSVERCKEIYRYSLFTINWGTDENQDQETTR